LLLLVAERGGFLKILCFDGPFLFHPNLFDLFLDILHVGWPRHGIDAGPRACFVHHIDRLIGKKSSGDITFGKFHRNLERFVGQLPSAGEFVFFNRSWYNRAGVERVMGFCTEKEVEEFFDTVNDFEALLVRSGLALRKYYLDISRKEQKERLLSREEDPLKTWKNSPIDAMALKKWHAYTKARDEMLQRTSHKLAPWRIVRADDKKAAHLEFIRDLLDSFSYPGKKKSLVKSKSDLVFLWAPGIEKAKLAR